MQNLQQDWLSILNEFQEKTSLKENQLIVIGCSTSEVAGEHIGTSGSEEIAEIIFQGLAKMKKETGVEVAFQCCEHLNRAIVVEEKIAAARNLPVVSAIPVKRAGGSMAAYAYQNMDEPVLVEHIQADAGIDIGDTFIGMHLKHVAVPVRLSVRSLGSAHLTVARTRPKLIGGERAVYLK
ncbi:TIGR01440 family protein [Bacillus gobiensis]|uniref:TIGR01440 family protein n=1 Tax=Bacillus gobiensis TaxID=1441095 RepID=UPI003D22D2C3